MFLAVKVLCFDSTSSSKNSGKGRRKKVRMKVKDRIEVANVSVAFVTTEK